MILQLIVSTAGMRLYDWIRSTTIINKAGFFDSDFNSGKGETEIFLNRHGTILVDSVN